MTRLAREDGWANFITALGVLGRDKRMGAGFRSNFVDEITAEELWESDDMAAKVIELKPKFMLRQGFTVQISDLSPASLLNEILQKEPDQSVDAFPTSPAPGAPKTPAATDPAIKSKPSITPTDPMDDDAKEIKDAQETVQNKLDDLNAISHLRKCEEFRRAYGGAALMLGIRDGRQLEKEVDEKNIESLEYLVPLRPRECRPVAWNTNTKSASYGQPVRYRVQRESATGTSIPFEVHATRIIRFEGIVVSKRQTVRNNGWGSSILGRFYDVLRDYQSAYSSSAVLLQEFSQAVLKIKGLADLLATGADGEEILLNRAKAIELVRSVCRAVMVDSEEDFERKATPIAGMDNLLTKWDHRLAAAADTPVSLLFGQEPAGLGSTGDANIRWYYDDVKSEQALELKPRANRIVRLIFLSKRDGPTNGKEPLRWKVAFPSLWQMTEKEKAEVRKLHSEADQIDIQGQVLTPEEVAVSAYGGDEYSGDRKLDMPTRSAMLKAEGAQIKPPEPPTIVVPPPTGAKKPVPAGG